MSKKNIISASDDTILKLKVLAKEKEGVRSKLAVTAKEKEDIRKNLAVTAKEKEEVRRELAVTAKQLAVTAKQLAATAKEKEETRRNLVGIAEEIRLKAKQLAVTAKEKEDAVIAAQNVLEDLSAEKLKYESLSKDLEKFKLAFDNVSDNTIMTDLDGIVIYANKAIETVTGYKPEEVIGKKSGLWKKPMPPEFYQKMWDTIKKQKKVFVDELQNKRKSGEIYTAAINIYPILDKNGEVEFFVSIERDITKEKELDRVKSEFISIASHQLRTPVSGLNWLTEALELDSGSFTPKQKKYVADLSTLSRRLIGLIEDLLNFSRIELKVPTVSETQIVEIPDFVDDFIKEIEPYAASTKHTIILNKGVAGPLTIAVNKRALYNVLQNLVSNAIDYSPENTSVTISAEKAGGFVKVSVSNKGPAVPKEAQFHLFERFYRAEEAKKIKPEGTGLGLYIVKAIIKGIGGKVGLESAEGKDTTFWFTVPLKEAIINKK